MSAPLTSRRTFLGGATAFAALPPNIGGHGAVVPPLDLPDVALTLQDGKTEALPSLVRGHVTAIQLMFTECTSTCPIGAATFKAVQAQLPDQAARGILLLSLDVGPFADQPRALRAWLERFHAGPGWLAAVPDPVGLPMLRELFGQGRDPNDPHSDRIQIVDRAGQLVWRTYELPSADDIVAMLKRA